MLVAVFPALCPVFLGQGPDPPRIPGWSSNWKFIHLKLVSWPSYLQVKYIVHGDLWPSATKMLYYYVFIAVIEMAYYYVVIEVLYYNFTICPQLGEVKKTLRYVSPVWFTLHPPNPRYGNTKWLKDRKIICRSIILYICSQLQNYWQESFRCWDWNCQFKILLLCDEPFMFWGRWFVIIVVNLVCCSSNDA